MLIYEHDNKLFIDLDPETNQVPNDPQIIIWKDEDGVHAKIGEQQIDG